MRKANRMMAGAMSQTSAKRVGLLAGSGRFPILFAEAAVRQGIEVVCVGIRHEASEELRSLCSSFHWAGVAKLGRMIRLFKKQRVDEVVMAGKVTKNVMYSPWRFVHLVPDLRMLHFWYKTCRRDKKDDSLLLGVIAEFARDHIQFTSALNYCPELLVKRGLLTKRPLSAADRADIAFGWNLAKEMGRLDVGQSVAVKELAAIAVEAIEGTDRCIERAGQLCRSGGWTLVKVAKPQQDMRFDVPTIGVSTIQNLHKAKAKVLAVEADKTIFVDQDQVVELANQCGVSIVALTQDEVAEIEQSIN